MKKSNLILLALIALSIVALIFTACGVLPHTVKYEVTGPSSTVDHIIYYNETGAMNTIYNVQIPWEKEFSVSGKNIPIGGGFTKYSSTDTYTFTIYVDGKKVKYASGQGTASATDVIKN